MPAVALCGGAVKLCNAPLCGGLCGLFSGGALLQRGTQRIGLVPPRHKLQHA